MKLSIFSLALCSAALFLSACNTNDPDTNKGGDTPTSQHQPSDPATWSPDRKLFVSIDSSKYSGDSIDVIAFWNSRVASFYKTDTETYDAREGYYNMFYNLPCYPNITLTNGNIKYHMTFIDTLTLYWDSLDVTYKYYPDYTID